MPNQRQEVGDNALAVQAGRDVAIGMTPAQMREILSALADQLTAYTSTARELVDARLLAFEERILRTFANPQEASTDAFKDPDFQYLLTRAQHSYARSGDAKVADALVEMIARRSREKDRNRLALTLNVAVEIAAVLTANEFAELSLTFVMRYTAFNQVADLRQLGAMLHKFINPLLPDVTRQHASYQYLQTHSCADIELGSRSVHNLLTSKYPGLLSKGFDLAQLNERLGEGKQAMYQGANLLMPCMNDPARFQVNTLNKAVFDEKSRDAGLQPIDSDPLWNFFIETLLSEQEMLAKLTPHFPELPLLIDLWTATPLNRLTLTTVGIAIGHANLRRIAQLDADLSIWIN